MPKVLPGQIKVDSSKLYYDAIWDSQKSNVSINSAIDYFEKLSDDFLSINDTINAINCIRSVTQGYFKKGAIFESELSVVKTFELLDKLPSNSYNKATRQGLSIHLGMLYRRINDYNSAIKYYKVALDLSESSKDSIGVLNNLANIYTDMEEYHSAVSTLNLVYEKIMPFEGYKNKWTVVDNLGFNQSKLNIPGALDRMQLALSKRLEKNDMEGAFSSYKHLTHYYIDLKNEFKALEFASKANELAESLKLPSFKLEALHLNALLHKDMNTREFVRLSDSINKAKKNNENKYVNKKYAYEQQERLANLAKFELVDSKLETERQKKTILIYLFSGILVLLASIFLIIHQKVKHKKDKLQEVYNTESRISKKVHDEVANDVFQLMTKLDYENQMDTEVISELSSLYARTRDISKEHGALNSDYPFIDHLGELIENFQDTQTNIIVKGLNDISWGLLPEIHRITIYKILQELLINMKKHSDASIVVLVFQKEKRKLTISCTDNGIGSALKKGNGLQNAENRIKSINGTIIFETEPNKGFKSKISI